MKFPLPKNIFPPLELSETEEQGYEQLANALIKATLAEYDQFVMHDRKRVDARRWKAVRSRDGVSIYRERDVDGVCRPAPATLALYQSAITTSRPSQNARASGGPHVSSNLSDGRNHTISINGPLHFGPPMTPKKSKSSSETDYSRDTSRNDSYSSGDLLSEPRITTGAFSSTGSESAGLPRLLAVGTLRGSLDDVMYGVVSPNASSVRLRSSYLGEHIADCAVLREMKSPSPSDPFRFLGIKWFVRAKHRGAARIVLPRDFVVLEFSGVMMRPDNSRVGFHLMHSIEIPTCRELHEHRILRAKLSSCYIFEETGNNRVQVFMTASVEPNGHVLNRMAVRSAATALSNCWKSVSCAHNKKLAFCLQNERPSAMGLSSVTTSRGGLSLGGTVIRSSRGGLSALTPVNESIVRESIAPEPVSQRSNYSSTVHRRQCGVCRGKLGVLSKSVLCQLCCEQICSRCRIVRKLSSDTLNSQVTQSSINFCKKCVASVNDESALEIARQELWVRSRGRTRASSAMSRTTARNSFSSERNTYATVVLGRGSEMNSRGSTATSSLGLSRGPSSYSQPSSFSQSRGPQQEESSLGFSVGPRPSTSTPSSTPLQRPSSGGRLSKNFSLNNFSMSAGPLSGNRVANDALSLSDLDNNKTVTSTTNPKTEPEEPVVLDHRMTMTIRSLRHLDYVLSVGEQDLVDELENEDTEEEFGGFESGDEDEGRSSYASSVAVLDDDYEACETMSNEPQSQREAPIVEGEEDEEEDEEENNQEPEQNEGQVLQQAGKATEAQDQSSESADEEQEPEQEAEGGEQDQDEAEKNEQTENTTVAMAMSVHGDISHADAAVAEEVEVVEAAPIAEVHAMMLNQYELQKNGKADAAAEPEPKQRLQRAHTTVPSSDTSNNYQNQLLQQMQDLHSVAESTYQVARANTEAAFKERDSGRISNGTGNLRGVRTYSQPFAFNVVGLRSTRAMTVGIDK